MFEVNDYVVYQYWVCQIVDITTIKNNIVGFDNNALFYVMKSLYEKETFYIPIENETSVRKPLDKLEALSLIDTLPNIVSLNSPNDDYYKNTIRNYDCYSYVQILKSIHNKTEYVNKIGKKLSISDNKYLHLAEKYLFDELSFALEIPQNSVDSFIKQRLNLN